MISETIHYNIKYASRMMSQLRELVLFYIQLIKLPQTGLLIFTAFAGYRSVSMVSNTQLVIPALIGLLFAISGATALNMVFDRDIDNVMKRTRKRPIPTEKISPASALIFGIILVAIGTLLSLSISLLYTAIVSAGIFFNFIIYTVWLKRRSPWSIVFGGLAGGMPVLAGRVLAVGDIDLIGILFVFSILFWIPTHILTLAMNYSRDYKLAGVPTFPNVFGFAKARYFIAISNALSAAIIFSIFLLTNIHVIGFYLCLATSIILFALSINVIINPGKKSNFILFRYASLYMVAMMFILVL